jgi:hypothetical protein
MKDFKRPNAPLTLPRIFSRRSMIIESGTPNQSKNPSLQGRIDPGAKAQPGHKSCGRVIQRVSAKKKQQPAE